MESKPFVTSLLGAKYEIGKKLGAGSFGVVHEAFKLGTDIEKPLVIKFINVKSKNFIKSSYHNEM